MLPSAARLVRLNGSFYYPNEFARIAARARRYLADSGYLVSVSTYSLPNSPSQTDGRPTMV